VRGIDLSHTTRLQRKKGRIQTDAALSYPPKSTAIRINIRIRLLPRFRPIRLRFEARTELIVVVRVLVLLIHRRITTLRLPVIPLLLRRRRLPRHLRVDRRIIAIDRFARLTLLRLLVHGHLVGQTPPAHIRRVLKIRSLPHANVQNFAAPGDAD